MENKKNVNQISIPLFQEIMKVTDNSYINNSRSIVVGAVKSFMRSPSSGKAQNVEALSGLQADWSDSDHGEGPKK